MDEISQWFEQEFGHLGFIVSPLMYDPENFIPHRGVLFRHPQINGGHTFKTHLRITPGLANDLSGGFGHLPDPVLEHKQLLTEAVNTFLESHGLPLDGLTDFKPIKKISKLKL